ncbi:MAG: nucleoside-diphosphate sugar epimerase/dehydratase [Verrucomicrobiota bacterium]
MIVSYGTLAAFTLWISYQLRFDFDVPEGFKNQFAFTMGWFVALKLMMLIAFGHFDDSISHFGVPDLKRVFGVCFLSFGVALGAWQFGDLSSAIPRSVVLIDCLISCMALCVGRLGLRMIRERLLVSSDEKRSQKVRRVGIIGANDTGATLARELLSKTHFGLLPTAFFDDVRRPLSRIHGIVVCGPPECIRQREHRRKFDEIVIALPSTSAARIQSIISLLREARIKFRTIPSTGQLATGRFQLTNVRPLEIGDLLGREAIQIVADNVCELVAGKTVVVTGAGGSIGSELCRQIVLCKPGRMIMVERSEAALFPIQLELAERGFGNFVPEVADILDEQRMERIFSRYRPQIVFHAAAHKHVPMMEAQPGEAIRNNVLGTERIAELSYEHKVSRFVMISTDKAINPTNVMGATKRIAESFVQSLQSRGSSATRFAVVRFGNVLGSSGSVVPTFARQIAEGGPIKVTHPEITRYFMTIPEAVSLVLQSAARAQGGEIYLLDMGKPVKIVDLARQMVELNGLGFGTDITVEFTGLRPGEKLYEELYQQSENVEATDHPKIVRLITTPPSYPLLKSKMVRLKAELDSTGADDLKLLLKTIASEYSPQPSEFSTRIGHQERASCLLI